MEIEYTNKYFGEALRELMDKKKLTYREFVEKSGVSKTYLTKILVHNLTPSKKIIFNIAKALGISPLYFKEFRIMRIIEKLEIYHVGIDEGDIKKLEDIIEIIKNKLPSDIKPLKLAIEKSIKYTPKYMLDLSFLEDHQSRIIKLIYNEYIKNNKKVAETNKDLEAFRNSEEFENAVDWAGNYTTPGDPEFPGYLFLYYEKYWKKKHPKNKKGNAK